LQVLFSARVEWVVADETWNGDPLPDTEKVSTNSNLPGSAILYLKTDGSGYSKVDRGNGGSGQDQQASAGGIATLGCAIAARSRTISTRFLCRMVWPRRVLFGNGR
jgi:hypothetical protein